MYYLMTRYYDPKTGRFINADSIEYLEPETINGLNLYSYCGNNPVMYVDPTGHEAILTLSVTIIVIIFGGVVGYFLGRKSPNKIEGNMEGVYYPGQSNESDDENVELTPEDQKMNALKGALMGAYVGALTVAAVGAFVALGGGITFGAQLFAFGTIGTIFIQPFLFGFGIEVETPELDPSDIYKPDLPINK